MEHTLSKKQRLSLLLISLFFHAALLTTLFLSLTDPHTQKLFAQEKKTALLKVLQELPQKHPRWVATKARASQFGVPVIFDDEPPPQSQSAAADAVSQAQQPTPQTTSALPAQNATTDDELSMQEQSTTDDTSHHNVEEKPELFDLKPGTIVQELTETPIPLTVDQKKQPEKTAASALTAKKTIAQQASISQQGSQPASQQTSGSGGIRKPITLAQIAKGFTENLKNKGNHSVTMRGEARGIPTDEQLKYERYLQRLQWCIQNSIKIHQRECRIPVPPKTSLDIHIGIDRSGSLTELALVRSSGIPDLDEFILFTFKDAGTSFPPVPAFFKEQLFTVLFIVKCLDAEQPGFRFFMQ